MQNSGTRGYSGYRGRRGGRRAWIAAALLLVILAAAVFLFAQRYRVYQSNGSSRYDLPWAREDGAPPDAGQAVELVLENADGTQTTVKGG